MSHQLQQINAPTKKLFVIAIGGTGSRVLKSLTMLLASGIDTPFQIVPIIIDPHTTNKDLQRTESLLKKYANIRSKLQGNEGFFKTEITSLPTLSQGMLEHDSYRLQLDNIDSNFKDYIDYNYLDVANKEMADFLFSGKTLDKHKQPINLLNMDMDIGFVGNPHVGSIVLNQITNSKEYQLMAQNFGTGDRIFIISSIFGGTGASGFPVLLKNLREGNAQANGSALKDAGIGAITVLPYFNIQTDQNSPINNSEFIAKTKSALYYYDKNINENHSLNALYYLADRDSTQPIANDPGHGGQQNKAHFIELVAALSILDFMHIPDGNIQSQNGRATNPIYKHFVLKNNHASVRFTHLDNAVLEYIYQPMVQMLLFIKYLNEELSNAIDKQRWSTAGEGNLKLNRAFFAHHDTYYHDVKEFLKEYKTWLDEMAKSDRAFKPLELEGKNNIAKIVLGQPVSEKSVYFGFSRREVGYTDFNEALNEVMRQQKDGGIHNDLPRKFISIFYEATKQLTDKYFQLQINH